MYRDNARFPLEEEGERYECLKTKMPRRGKRAKGFVQKVRKGAH